MNKILFICLIFMISYRPSVSAQGMYNDIGSFEFIMANGKIEQDQLETQLKYIALLAVEHEHTTLEYDKITGFEKQFKNYIATFHHIIAYAAEFYGLYYECKIFTEAFEEFSSVASSNAENIVAVALITNQTYIYKDIINTAGGILSDITTLLGHNSKGTETDRLTTLLGMRPKIHKLTKKLHTLTRMVKYTTMEDVWLEITHQAYSSKSKKDIITKSRTKWESKAASVNSKLTYSQ